MPQKPVKDIRPNPKPVRATPSDAPLPHFHAIKLLETITIHIIQAMNHLLLVPLPSPPFNEKL
jgi:hypothetical protein